jgi:hypothetical protein
LNEINRYIDMLRESVNLALETMDPKNPTCLNISDTLASKLSRTRRLEEAKQIQRKILETTLSLHPAPEIQSLSPALDLTSTLEKMSCFEEAYQVLEPGLLCQL